MTDILDDPEAFKLARQLFVKQGVSSTKKARKDREKKLKDTVDRRSLRATGRTAQFNFKCHPSLKERAYEAAKAERLPISEWMENAVLAALGIAKEDL